MILSSIIKYSLIGGGIYLLTRYGCKTAVYVVRKVSKIFECSHSQTLDSDSVYSLGMMELHLASTERECEEFLGNLTRLAEPDCFIGLDCEWVLNEPVALIQLSTKSGYCVIVHLSKLQTVPPALKSLLEDDTILKAGVGTPHDAKLLYRDYNVDTKGCIDLRFLAPIRHKMGLAALANDHLNITLDKCSRIRRSNWAADVLTEEQLRYAGLDAFVGALIFSKLTADIMKEARSGSYPDARAVAAPHVGIHFKGPNNKENSSKSARRLTTTVGDEHSPKDNENSHKHGRAYVPRKTPIYSNCKMLAPDEEVLCTCSRKKADWYVAQGLAREVCLEPYTIQLLFEPAERFRSGSGQYYLKDKINQCAVCGKKDSHLRKTVVPHEYRRHFPDAMKKHQSHDVLPLCQHCHLRSNAADVAIRQKLAVQCDALIGVGNDVKATDDPRLKKLRSAARALRFGGDDISAVRREELKLVITQELPYYEEMLKTKSEEEGAGDVSALQDLPLKELVKRLTRIDISIPNANYIPHGLKVTEYYAREGIEGLMKLERLWREHFVETMKPQFLPDLWSVSHYHHNERAFKEDDAFKNRMAKIRCMENKQL